MKPTEIQLAGPRKVIAEAIERIRPTHIVGVDEVGYGACAGPLVIGAVYVPVDWKPPEGLTDSKLLSETEIGHLAKAFQTEMVKAVETDNQVHWCLISFDHETIDRHGLGRTRTRGLLDAAERSIERCKNVAKGKPLAFVDGNLEIEGAVSVPKADYLVPAVSMAAVMAKFARDTWMRHIATTYPGYGFENHKGYDTAAHRTALQKLGPCAIHRKSNRTVESFTPKSNPLTEMLMNGDFDD